MPVGRRGVRRGRGLVRLVHVGGVVGDAECWVRKGVVRRPQRRVPKNASATADLCEEMDAHPSS
jgi:hypothetical protein